MLNRVLIANRGEIAVRIVRACREMGVTSIAVYSTADAGSLHTRLADESVCIGPPPPTDSYLNIPSIIAAAEVTDAQAIHPGYGFLSENAKFAKICRDCHIRFIGPTPEAIALSGDKSACRQAVHDAGVPVVPGSEGCVKTPDEALAVAQAVGFPVLIKAAAGGGGKGMRIAHNDASMKHAVAVAMGEAKAAFGDEGIYVEKVIEEARHVEVQILGDDHGTLISLGERECTIQRRHQKLIEESPSTALDDDLRARMEKAALDAARAINYTNAGTVEFVLDKQGHFYFIEFNARIQVEHPVTEEVTDLDLVREQLRIAAGAPLGYTEAPRRGHAIEARVYAENPEMNFAPSPGTIHTCHIPGGPGIRVDTHLYTNCVVSQYYDALLAKVIAHANTRAKAIERLSGALEELVTDGVHTTARLCAHMVRSDRFGHGDLGPDLIDEHLPSR
ncbi:MAG: acetyl/propionyl/methylcrotonyl-CoA carboxylase subunit alpha [Candidatus Hydrogenedentota bacterium]